MNTAGRLKEIMEERNLKQVDIVNLAKPYCDALDVKMNKSDISQYLSGKTKPNQDKLFVLSRALGVEIPWLMGYDVPRYYQPKEPKYYDDPEQTGFSIPILGKVAAGIPIEAVEDFRGEVTVSEDLFRKGELFALEIHGDSMSPSILDGDVVIVREQPDAESGEIVIATIDGQDATCKRLRKYKEGIELIANNPSYAPLEYSNEEIMEKPVKILGKVVELRRSF